jgi:hypothetical protein
MSQLSQGLKIILEPVSSPSSTLIEVDSPGQSVMESAGVPKVLNTQCNSGFINMDL